MFLWLKVLAFGFAFLDKDVFIKGQTSGTTSQSGIIPTSTKLTSHADSDSSFGSSTQPHSSTAALTTLMPDATSRNSSDDSDQSLLSNTTLSSVSHIANSTPADISQTFSNSTSITPTFTTGMIPTGSTNLTTHADSNSSFESSTQPHSSTAALTSLMRGAMPHNSSDDPTLSHSYTISPPVNNTPTSTSANISQTSSSFTSITPTLTTETTTVITTMPPCDVSATLHYCYNGTNAVAKLNFTEEKSEYNISCKSSCKVNKDDKHIVELKECDTYEIEIESRSCSKASYRIIVPPDSRRFHLENRTITNTSIKLSWNTSFDCQVRYNFSCELAKDNQNDTNENGKLYSPHYKNYICNRHVYNLEKLPAQKGSNETIDQAGKDNNSITSNPGSENLLPNTNYTCTGLVYYHGKLFAQESITRTTDYGIPDKPEDFKRNSATSRSILFTWTKPKNGSKSPIYGYCIKCGDHAETDKNETETSFNCTGLEPYKNYTVFIKAYTIQRYSQQRIYSEVEIIHVETAAAEPEEVTIITAYLVSSNAIRIICKNGSVNGPSILFILEWKGEPKNQTECNFTLENLSYLTTYTYKVYVDNGPYSGRATAKEHSLTTKYNSQALIIFLAFLIIVTSIALLIVLYKIYDLHREKLSNSGEEVVLVNRDDEKQLMNVEPIPAEMLLESYKRKMADEGRLFLDEFQSIPRVFSKFPIKEARKNYNQNKNRYIDILPYDYNRVELSQIDGDPGSDYINASHIDGFKEPRKYIAAQGPKEETTDDFWRMIWEQKATIIVMVTRCEENNRNKCAQYWPSAENTTATFGDIVVKSNESKMCPDYIVQKLHITNKKEKTPGRDVTHIQFTSWPDHGVPDDPHLLLKLRRRVNALSNFFSGPIVIHCSAGVGRTGTYIGIDAMLEGLEAEGRVDVYGYVVKLRRQRCLMVQVEAQYILIHQALVEYNQFGETEVTLSELHTYLNNLKKRDSPSDPTLLEAEFQRLPTYRGWRTQNTANRQENKSKNRNSKMVPYDFNRVPIRQEEEKSKESEHDSEESSDEESDCEEANRYINASFISGYWGPKEMIATQGPLPETISDFWQMIFQRRVKVIVMLTELNEGDQQLCEQYWGEGKQRYEGIEVEVTDVNQSSNYTIRAFDVTSVKRKETRKVFQYQYHKWNGLNLPENPKDLVTMILNLKQKLPATRNTEDSRSIPLVIHCRDGSEQTGVFCALMTLLESAETEEVIDAFQVVKSLRRTRPGMVSSFEQYQFLYDTIASIYPAQNGEVKKNSKQEDTVEINNEVEKKDQEADLITIDINSVDSVANQDMELCEDSKSADSVQGTESSANGPTTPILTEIV